MLLDQLTSKPAGFESVIISKQHTQGLCYSLEPIIRQHISVAPTRWNRVSDWAGSICDAHTIVYLRELVSDGLAAAVQREAGVICPPRRNQDEVKAVSETHHRDCLHSERPSRAFP